MRLRSRFLPPLLSLLFVAAAGAVVFSACGKSSSSSGKKSRKTKTSKTFADPAVGGTIAISAGSVDIAANTLAAGSEVALQKVTQPAKFAATAVLGAAPASNALALSVKDSSGNAVTTLNKPVAMTIKISTDGAGLLLATGTSDLCVLFESPAKEYLAWYNSTLTINESAGTVAFRTKRTGTYQLFRCGENQVPDFDNAAETYASGLLDGTWLLTGETCGVEPDSSVASRHQTMVLGASGLTFTYSETYSEANINCTHTYQQPVTFPGAGMMTLDFATAETCTPVSPGICGEHSCLPAGSEGRTVTSAVTASTWTLTDGFHNCTSTYTLQ
jgi:hypothetical protein